VLFFYGGAFRAGRKSEYRWSAKPSRAKAYRRGRGLPKSIPKRAFPIFSKRREMRWPPSMGGAVEFGGDAARISSPVTSRAAYISVMLAANPAYLRAANADPSWIRGVIAIAGRYHE